MRSKVELEPVRVAAAHVHGLGLERLLEGRIARVREDLAVHGDHLAVVSGHPGKRATQLETVEAAYLDAGLAQPDRISCE